MNKNLFYHICIWLLTVLTAFFLISSAVYLWRAFPQQGGPLFTVLGLAAALGLWFWSRNSKGAVLPKSVWPVIAAAFVLRLLWAFFVQVPPASDYQYYYEIAAAFAQGAPLPHQEYIALFPHAMGYPYILSLIFRIFGVKTLYAALFNVVLSTGTVWLAYLAARNFSDHKTAITCSILLAVMPNMIALVSLVSAETLYCFLISAFLFFFSWMVKRKQFRWYDFALLGLCCAAANFIRPVTVLVVLAVIFYCVCFCKKNLRKQNLIACTVLAVAFFVGLQVLHLESRQLTGLNIAQEYSGYNLFVGMNPASGGAWNQADYDLAFDLARQTSPQQAQSSLKKEAFQRAFKDPLATLRLIVKKQATIWGEDGYGFWWNRICLKGGDPQAQDGYLYQLEAVSNAFYLLLLAGAVFGLLGLAREKSFSPMIFLVLLILAGIAAFSFVEAQSRYRFFLMPAYTALSAYGLLAKK